MEMMAMSLLAVSLFDRLRTVLGRNATGRQHEARRHEEELTHPAMLPRICPGSRTKFRAFHPDASLQPAQPGRTRESGRHLQPGIADQYPRSTSQDGEPGGQASTHSSGVANGRGHSTRSLRYCRKQRTQGAYPFRSASAAVIHTGLSSSCLCRNLQPGT